MKLLGVIQPVFLCKLTVFIVNPGIPAWSKAAQLWLDLRVQVDVPYLVSICGLPADIQPHYSRLPEGPRSYLERMSFKK